MKIYIAGPMTGYENYNREAFHAKANELNNKGHHTLNPATLPDGLSQPEYMDICFAMIRSADAVHFLPGWKRSEGALAEYHYAKKIGLELICSETSQLAVA
ncbi:DUF4406 domain-containing protein [Vibrio parahaemolyticus]|nr:DUF4406 domain-containing protein [Vibrio parahaemolyticus]